MILISFKIVVILNKVSASLFWFCIANDHVFERNEDCATVFLKWTDFNTFERSKCQLECAQGVKRASSFDSHKQIKPKLFVQWNYYRQNIAKKNCRNFSTCLKCFACIHYHSFGSIRLCETTQLTLFIPCVQFRPCKKSYIFWITNFSAILQMRLIPDPTQENSFLANRA